MAPNSAAMLSRHAVERAKIDPAEVDDVILGCGMPERATGQNIARQSAIARRLAGDAFRA